MRHHDDGANNVYNLTVSATDSSGNTSDLAVTVTVNDIDDTNPVITGSDSVSVLENQTSVSTYNANETVTWSLSGTDSGFFSISNTGELTFSSAPDYEAPLDDGANNEYNLTVTATDSSGNTSDLAVTVTVNDIDDTNPVITGSSSVSVVENQTAVFTYNANETVTWSLSGTDSGFFSISNTGELTFSSAPDYEAPR